MVRCQSFHSRSGLDKSGCGASPCGVCPWGIRVSSLFWPVDASDVTGDVCTSTRVKPPRRMTLAERTVAAVSNANDDVEGLFGGHPEKFLSCRSGPGAKGVRRRPLWAILQRGPSSCRQKEVDDIFASPNSNFSPRDEVPLREAGHVVPRKSGQHPRRQDHRGRPSGNTHRARRMLRLGTG
jgi:hypothetical protein